LTFGTMHWAEPDDSWTRKLPVQQLSRSYARTPVGEIGERKRPQMRSQKAFILRFAESL
jgi:hypothetical protein